MFLGFCLKLSTNLLHDASVIQATPLYNIYKSVLIALKANYIVCMLYNIRLKCQVIA